MKATPTPPADSPVESLFRQRDQLQGWISRLGDVQGQVPGHVAERVRRDYEERLRAVTAELSTHRGAILADLDARRAEMDHAEERRAAAADDLEEVRLRHMIGELDDAAWEARRPGLEGVVATAETEAARARSEVERLDGLLRGLDSDPADAGEPEPAPVVVAAAAAAPVVAAAALPERDATDDTIPEFDAFPGEAEPAAAGDDEATGFDLSWLDEVEQVSGGPAPEAGAPAPDAAPAADGEDTAAGDLAFLEELDRAIASSEPGEGPADPDRTLDADRAGMLLCKECGAINEPQLWYCEVCGSEL